MPISDNEFDAFFRRSYPRLVTHLIVMGLPRESAKDSAQEAMIKAYQHWEELLDEEAWVRKVAYHHAVKTYRRDLMRLRKEEEAASKWVLDITGPLPGTQVDLRQQGDAVIAALQALPPGQRRVMAWLIDGYTPKEIAQHTGGDEGTVRSNIRHARRSLVRRVEGSTEPE